MRVTVIGVDCATDARRVGLALGTVEGGRAKLVSAQAGSGSPPVETIEEWVSRDGTTLLALDAPLGWPSPMALELPDHRAGRPLRTPREDFFSRETDRMVRRELGKLPLEVGANLIARTAHAALDLLEQLRRRARMDIVLAWNPQLGPGLHVIEVYPAATLIAHGIGASNYKEEGQHAARETIVAALAELIELPRDLSPLVGSADALDAAVCILAGLDFLSGTTIQPLDLERASKEGWIWVRRPVSLSRGLGSASTAE